MFSEKPQEYHDYIKIFKKMKKIASLYAIRNYSCSAIKEINKPIDTAKVETNENALDMPIFKSLFRLEDLTRDILAYGETWKHDDSHSLCNWKRLTKAHDNRNTLDGKITELMKNNYGDKKIIHTFFVLGHDQFTYQTQSIYNIFCKYFWIYSEPNLAKYIEDYLGISVKSIYILGLSYFGEFGKHFEMNEKSELEGINITNEDNLKFHELFSCELGQIAEIIKTEKEKADYSDILHSGKRCLADTPLYKIGNGKIICPLPHMLISRITSGITYKFTGGGTHNGTFGELLGSAFEKFIGSVISENNKEKQRIIIEGDKGSGVTDADRFIQEEDNLFIIECKARKLTNNTKTLLSTTKSLEHDIEIIVNALIQSYESSLEQNISKKFGTETKFQKRYCIIVLFEETFLRLIESFPDNPYKDILKDKIKEELDKKKIKEEDFYSREYLIVSSFEFEITVQYAKRFSFKEIIEGKKKKYSGLFGIKGFIDEEYGNKIELEKPFYNEKILNLMDDYLKTPHQ